MIKSCLRQSPRAGSSACQPHSATAGLAASALCLESSATCAPGLDSQLNTSADSTTDVAISTATKASNTLGTQRDQAALCCHSCDPQLLSTGFAQGQEVPVLCHFTGAAQGRACCCSISWACCSNLQPRRLRLEQMHTKESQASSFLSSPTKSGLFKCDSRHWDSKHCAVKQVTLSCSTLASIISA